MAVKIKASDTCGGFIAAEGYGGQAEDPVGGNRISLVCKVATSCLSDNHERIQWGLVILHRDVDFGSRPLHCGDSFYFQNNSAVPFVT